MYAHTALKCTLPPTHLHQSFGTGPSPQVGPTGLLPMKILTSHLNILAPGQDPIAQLEGAQYCNHKIVVIVMFPLKNLLCEEKESDIDVIHQISFLNFHIFEVLKCSTSLYY